MKAIRIVIKIILFASLAGAAWVVLFHSNWVKPEHKEEEEAEPVTEVPVHVTKITRATLHRYIECLGLVVPELRKNEKDAASARIASPVAGVVAEVLCVEGQQVEKGAVLFKLDDRLARNEVNKAEAALASAQATLTKTKTSTRPEQIALARIALKKAQQAMSFAVKADERQKALAKDQLAAGKQLEESELQLASAKEDHASAEKQLALLENSPSPEEIAEATAKVTEAEKALAAAHLQESLLIVKAPLKGKVVKININPGEPIDTTTILAEIIDVSRLEVLGTLPALQLNELHVGQSASILADRSLSGAAPNKSDPAGKSAQDTSLDFKSAVSSIGQQIDPKNDTITIRVPLAPDAKLIPGQSVRLIVTVLERPHCMVVPEECVFNDKVGIPVIAVVENNKSSLANVTPGIHENGLIEIEGKDIKDGDTVVSAGAYGLPEETKVRILQDDESSRGRKP
jgi:membrane fusion protein (multidrug efflux system)